MKDLPMFNKLFFVLYSSLLISLVPMGAAAQGTIPVITTGSVGFVGMELGIEATVDPMKFNSLPPRYQRSIKRHMLMERKATIKHLNSVTLRAISPNAIGRFAPGLKYLKPPVQKARGAEVCSNSVCHNKRRAALYARVQAEKERMYGKKPQSTIKYITKDGNINTLTAGSRRAPQGL